ncbi:epidermal growth factor receptor kinase substrate 8-like [Polistes fuscatus]|uniref:epidermal growth factor receptor kinase substrate 8-like n=1 Tax=Polistes fuscatus TaxID=30207 RepID=UPI001CA81C9F|nr:epidermal growth factor receptor kinase substrate 8-like [Polistes fuscatus]
MKFQIQKTTTTYPVIHQEKLQPPATATTRAVVATTPSPPPPPPPPLPALTPPPQPSPVLQTQKSTTSTSSNKSELNKNNKFFPGKSNQDQVHEELKYVLNMFREKKFTPNIVEMQTTVLHQYSTPREVQSWLTTKGFSDKVCKQLRDMTGAEIFNLTKRQLEQYFGPDEGGKLEQQLILSRNECRVSLTLTR